MRRVPQLESFEANSRGLSGHTTRERGNELLEPSRHKTIEVVFAVTSHVDQTGHAQQGQVVTDRRLPLSKQLAQLAYVQFIDLLQKVQNANAGVVRQELEQIHDFP